MNYCHAIILGIIEGLTEFLPISSTGHLILASKLMGFAQTEFLGSFQICIQLGAILAVVSFYGRTLLGDIAVWKKIIAAFIPTMLLGLIFYPFIKEVLLGHDQVVLWSLLIGGILLIVFDRFHKEDENATGHIVLMPYRTAFLIGLFQSVAMIPGVSRSAATIMGGLILGMKRKTIVEFSFLLAIPTMVAATTLDLVNNGHSFSPDQWTFLSIGFVFSFVIAFFSIQFFLYYIQRHNFSVFGIYRIVLVLFLSYLFYVQ